MATDTAAPQIDVAPPRGWRTWFTQENIITTIVGLIVAVAVILPLVALVVNSFLVQDDLGFETEWGLQNYREIFQGRVIKKALINTAIISTGCTILATFLGVSLAWINARTNCPFREQLEPFNLIPFFLSPFVGAIAWHNLASPKVGLLNNMAKSVLGIDFPLFNVNNLWGVIWVTGIFFAPSSTCSWWARSGAWTPLSRTARGRRERASCEPHSPSHCPWSRRRFSLAPLSCS